MMVEFVQARNYTKTSGRQVDLVVIHSMENAETGKAAENVASWFASSTAPRASAHRCFDNDSQVQCVRIQDVAWHAPGANHNGIGYEHAGRAAQTREQWLDAYGVAMLERSAAQCRIDCADYGIPIGYVDAAGLLRGWRGITTHWDVTKAFHKSSHWDPGAGFPMGTYLEMVRGAPAPAPQPPVPVPVDHYLLRRGASGQDVKEWQKILIGAKLLPPNSADGIFGAQTEEATRKFQTALGVTADGVVGPQTREATARLLAWLAASQPIPAIPPFPGVVKFGSFGSAVSMVQDRLRERGWTILVDGKFGHQTDSVVRKFQAEKGLQVDGVVGSKTWNALWAAPVT